MRCLTLYLHQFSEDVQLKLIQGNVLYNAIHHLTDMFDTQRLRLSSMYPRNSYHQSWNQLQTAMSQNKVSYFTHLITLNSLT